MHLFSHFMFSLLSFSLIASGLSKKCDKTQYAWPIDNPTLCCNMCKPGEYMSSRPPTTCNTQCNKCTGNLYMDSYNVELSCNVCDHCEKPNFVKVSDCNETHNTVCKCKTGYRCRDSECTKCELIPLTTKLIPTSSTTVLQRPTSSTSSTTIKDTVWFLVIIALLCVGIGLVVWTKMKQFLHWIRSNHGYLLAGKHSTEPSTPEDDDVSKPVQEVCGKCDQPISNV